MRVISGDLGGRQFEAPKGFKTHPMGDRPRGALFNMLGDISGLTVLDPFAGSGALSFEAISRGAISVVAIEQDNTAQQVIKSNLINLGLDGKIKLIQANSGSWLQNNQGVQFDLVLCDPPYNDPQPNLIKRLSQVVKPGGILVLSWPAEHDLPELNGLKLLDHRRYANLTLAFYRQKV
jgi:16S rRNA (guanine966-N2)-methyltransferase